MSLEEENNMPSDSDSDDDDYVPTGAGEALSEEESGNESNDEEGGDNGEGTEGAGKRKKSQKKPRKSRKKIKPVLDEKENEEEKPSEELSFEEKKKRASSLWEDFMKDVGTPVAKKKPEEPAKVEEKEKTKEVKAPTPQQPAKVKITELFEFAGEKVEVEREVVTSSVSSPIPGTGAVVKASSGISGILGQLGKKGKLSTLEKSKLDWDKFKKQEGIDQEIGTFNKGKNGFLEKQDFLQRTDLRQFEIEKEMRNKRRSSNR
uniref:Craniofacial development protein 1 n=1 Tax=Lygus hesperus TaxID=30085 RepID=A0A0K8T9N8_LYGHE